MITQNKHVVLTYYQVIYAVNECFIVEVRNNLQTSPKKARILECLTAHIEGVFFSICLSFEALKILNLTNP